MIEWISNLETNQHPLFFRFEQVLIITYFGYFEPIFYYSNLSHQFNKMKCKKENKFHSMTCVKFWICLWFFSTNIFQFLTYERLNFQFGFKIKLQLINLCNRLNEIFSAIIKNNNFLFFWNFLRFIQWVSILSTAKLLHPNRFLSYLISIFIFSKPFQPHYGRFPDSCSSLNFTTDN